MNPERARELLGGLAAGILTPEEKQILFEAALHDQTLFNEVADEMELAAFLQSPESRAQLANRIPQITEESARRPWWALRPALFGIGGALAASIFVFFAVGHRPAAQHALTTSSPQPEARLQLKPEAQARDAASPPASSVRNSPLFRAAPIVTASLSGTVHDASGAAVGNAAIKILNTSTKKTTPAVSDSNGYFVAPALPVGGPYTVIAQAPGFNTLKRFGITLAANRPAQIDIPLQVGTAAETVDITAAGAQVAAAKPSERAAVQQAPASQIAVLDFSNSTAQRQSGQQAADQLSNQLLDSGQRVINRDKVQQAWQSQSQQTQAQQKPGSPPSAKEAAELGRTLGADAVIVGSIQPSAAVPNVAVSAEVIDTKKARPMARAAAINGSLQGATTSVGNQLQFQLTLASAGVVTSVDEDNVHVSFAATTSPQINARFDVYRAKIKIGSITLTSLKGHLGAGKFSGSVPPLAGDRIMPSR